MKGQRQLVALPSHQFIQRQCRRAFGHFAEHDGAKDRNNDRTAEGAKEIQRTGGRTELMRLDRILHDDRADWIHRSESATENKQEANDFAECLSRWIDGERDERYHGDDKSPE